MDKTSLVYGTRLLKISTINPLLREHFSVWVKVWTYKSIHLMFRWSREIISQIGKVRGLQKNWSYLEISEMLQAVLQYQSVPGGRVLGRSWRFSGSGIVKSQITMEYPRDIRGIFIGYCDNILRIFSQYPRISPGYPWGYSAENPEDIWISWGYSSISRLARVVAETLSRHFYITFL